MDGRIAKSPRERALYIYLPQRYFSIYENDKLGVTNRALLFGLIFAFSFPLYFLDHRNSTATLASWLGSTLQRHPDLVARLLFAFAAILVIVAALVRTWASSYLCAGVVYAAQVKTESLVADGPYRQVRNPLYFANVLMVNRHWRHDEPPWVFRSGGGNGWCSATG